MKETTETFLRSLIGKIGPVIKRQTERSKNYPFYKGLVLERNFPVSKVGEKVWYTVLIEMQWYADRYSISRSFQIIITIYFPIRGTRDLYCEVGKPSLKSNVCSFIKNQTYKSLENFAMENNFFFHKDNVFPYAKNSESVFTTEDSIRILGFDWF